MEELMILRALAPEGQYVLPMNREQKMNILVVGNVQESVEKNWFAMILDNHQEYVAALVEMVDQRMS